MSTGVHFECVADGYQSETFKYQWTLNGSEIAGAIDKMLTVAADEDGTYGCIVTNYWNMTANSNLVQLTVTSNCVFVEIQNMYIYFVCKFGKYTTVT